MFNKRILSYTLQVSVCLFSVLYIHYQNNISYSSPIGGGNAPQMPCQQSFFPRLK